MRVDFNLLGVSFLFIYMYLAKFLHLFSAALRCQSASASGSTAGCMPGWEWPSPQLSRSSPLVGSGRPWRNPPTVSLFCVIALGIQELGFFIGFRAPWKDFQVFIFYPGRVHMPGFCPGWEQRSIYETSCLRKVRHTFRNASRGQLWNVYKGLCGPNKLFQNFLISPLSAHCLKPYFHRM